MFILLVGDNILLLRNANANVCLQSISVEISSVEELAAEKPHETG